MGRLKYFGFVASLFMVAPGLARAKDANLMADVRCVIIGVRMMGFVMRRADKCNDIPAALAM